jgi:hypothetical protein
MIILTCSNGRYHWHSLALSAFILLYKFSLKGPYLCTGILSDVYIKSKPTGQYEKFALAGGQIYVYHCTSQNGGSIMSKLVF